MPTVVRSQVGFDFTFYIFPKKAMNLNSQAMGISSFVAGLGLLAFPYINSLVSRTIMLKAIVISVVH